MCVRKTSIAVEFCYRRKQERPCDHIFWVYGNSEGTLGANYIGIYQAIRRQSTVRAIIQRLDCKEDDPERQIEVVRLWLEVPCSGGWTMIVDNLDDVPENLNKYLRNCRGTILFTTCNADLFTTYKRVSATAVITVLTMSNEEATEQFSKLLGPTIPCHHSGC